MAADRLELRSVERAEVAAFLRAADAPFGFDPDEDELSFWAGAAVPEQTLAVFDRGRIVATALWRRDELTLPAAGDGPCPVLPVAGVTAVGVLPTHRRRGLLTALMDRQLADMAEQGRPLAALFASEAVIYGRFGYGIATSSQQLAVSTRGATFASQPTAGGGMRLADAEDAAKVLPGVHDQARRRRPGETSRTEEEWGRILRDVPERRQGGGPRWYAVHESERGEPDGYVSYRYHRPPAEATDICRVAVDDLLALDPAGHAALWRFVLDLDLVEEVTCDARPLDDPLRWLLADPRRARTTGVTDQLWVRILDVPAALGARGYRAEGRLVLDVRGPWRDATGRFVLDVGPDGVGECRRARPGEAADLAVGLADVGALYLGGVPPSALARVGRVEELRAGAVDRADRLLAARVAPFTSTDF